MKRRRAVKIIIWMIVIIVVIIASVLLYLKLYGKNIIEARLSDVLGRPIKFESVSLDIKNYTVEFKGFRIPARLGFKGKDLFQVDKLTLILDKDKFNKDRKVVFDQITVKSGILHVERNNRGALNIATDNIDKSRYEKGIAYADISIPKPQPMLLYKFTKGVKKLIIKDSIIKFTDSYIYGVPYQLNCDNFNLDLASGEMPEFMSLTGALSFAIPNRSYNVDGKVFVDISMAVYEYMSNMEINVNTQHIDVMQFQPYFEEYTPFYFNEGLFSSTTKFEIHSNAMRSLTTMAFHRLKLLLKPGMQNTQFLDENVNKLVPYLTSQSGDIIFDFTISGPVSNPQFGLGPKVKYAMTMVAVEEVGKALQQLQR